MSLSLLLHQCPLRLVHLTCIVCVVGGKWPYNCCVVGSSKQHVASLCSSHQAFSQNVSLDFKWCNHTVVLTWLQLGRIPNLFYERDQISIQSIICQQESILCLFIC